MKPSTLLVSLCLALSALFAEPPHLELPTGNLIFYEVMTKTPFVRSWASIEYGETLDLINTLHSSAHSLHYPDTRANIYYYTHLKGVNSLYQKYNLIASFVHPNDFYDLADYNLIVDKLKLRAYAEFLFKDLLSFLFTKYPLDYKTYWKEELLTLSSLYKTTDYQSYQETAVCKKQCVTLLLSFLSKLPTEAFDAWTTIIKRLNEKDQLDIIPEEAGTFEEVQETTMRILAQPVLHEDIFELRY